MNNACAWCNLTPEEQKYLLLNGRYWDVYLADKQDYIGRCILVLHRHCASLSELNADEWAELKVLIDKLESAVTAALGTSMFNWSCLMNDFYKAETPQPHLHIHVRPRYQTPVTINGKVFFDEEFAHHYDNRKPNKLTEAEANDIFRRIHTQLTKRTDDLTAEHHAADS